MSPIVLLISRRKREREGRMGKERGKREAAAPIHSIWLDRTTPSSLSPPSSLTRSIQFSQVRERRRRKGRERERLEHPSSLSA